MSFELSLSQRVVIAITGALAFGFYFATFVSCIRWLFFMDDSEGPEWNLRQRIRWPVVTVTFLIFACNVVYLALDIFFAMTAAWDATTHALPRATPWASILDCTAADCVVLLADVVLIWRCWVVYGKRRLIILFPCFLWLSALLCTILQVYLQTVHIHNPDIGPYEWASVNMTFGPGIVLLPFWICTVLLNAYSTAALVRRIYLTAKKSSKDSTSMRHLHLAIRIVAESGLLYFSITFAHLMAWFGEDEFPVSVIGALNAPIIGIGFNWFLIRFGRNRAETAAKEANVPDLSTIRFTKSTEDKMTIDTLSTDTALVLISPDAEKLAVIQDKEEALA